MKFEFSGQSVAADPSGSETKYDNYTVIALQPEDFPSTVSQRMIDFVRARGDLVGLTEGSLPRFASKVRTRYASDDGQ